MSDSIFKQIETAVVAALSSGTPVSLRIQTGDARPLATQYDDGVLVRVRGGQLTPAAILGGPLQLEATLDIELRTLGPAATSAASALDVLLLAVNSRITAAPSLGISGLDCALAAVAFDTDPTGEQPAHSAVMSWTVTHEVARTTLA